MRCARASPPARPRPGTRPTEAWRCAAPRRRRARRARCRRAAGGPARARRGAARGWPGGCAPPRARPGSGPRRPGARPRRRRAPRARSDACSKSICARSRVQPGLVEHARAPGARCAVCSGIDALVRRRRRQAQPGARLLEGRLRLLDAQLVVGRDRGARSPGPAAPGCRGRRRSPPARPATFMPSTTCSSAASVPAAMTTRATRSWTAGCARTTRARRRGRPLAGQTDAERLNVTGRDRGGRTRRSTGSERPAASSDAS